MGMLCEGCVGGRWGGCTSRLLVVARRVGDGGTGGGMLIFGRSTYTYCFVYGDVLFYSTDVVEPSHTPKTFRYRTRIVKEARTRSRASDPQTSISSARSLAKSGLLLRAAGRTNKPRRVVDHTNNYCTVRYVRHRTRRPCSAFPRDRCRRRDGESRNAPESCSSG